MSDSDRTPLAVSIYPYLTGALYVTEGFKLRVRGGLLVALSYSP